MQVVGKFRVGKYFPIFDLIYSAVKAKREFGDPSSPSPLSTPLDPNPFSPMSGMGAGSCQSAQGRRLPPATPLPTQSLSLPGTGHPGQGSSRRPAPKPPVPSLDPSSFVNSQNGARHVAGDKNHRDGTRNGGSSHSPPPGAHQPSGSALPSCPLPPIPSITSASGPSLPSSLGTPMGGTSVGGANHASSGSPSPPSCRPPTPPTASDSHATGTGCGVDRKKAILAFKQSHRRALPADRKARILISSSDEEEEEDDNRSSSDTGPGSSWRRIRKEALREGDLDLVKDLDRFAAPVVVRRGNQPKWEQIPYKELKDLRRAAKDYGRNSPYFKNVLDLMFNGYDLVPHDLKYIASSLLSPTEYMVWEGHWKKLLRPLVNKYNLQQLLGEGNDGLEALMGEGEFDRPEDQVLLPFNLLADVKQAGKAALLKVPDDSTPLQSFASIRQEETESFIKFVDRMREAIDRQIDNPDARGELLIKMVMSNANAETKKILRALPQDPEPTITDMVNACTRASSLETTLTKVVTKGMGEAMTTVTKEMGETMTTVTKEIPPRSPAFLSGSEIHLQPGKRMAERDTAPRDDNKWTAASPSAPHHQGGRIPNRVVSQTRDLDNGIRFLRRTRNLSNNTRYLLHSGVTLLLTDEDLVRVPAGFLPPPYCEQTTTVLILADTRHTPEHITVTPEVVTLEPRNEVTVSITCIEPPFTLQKGTPFAQMYILSEQDPCAADNDYRVFLSQHVTKERPVLPVSISYKGKSIKVRLMADTGADITIIPRSMWPSNWELVSPCGTISGVGGTVNSLRSKHHVCVEGPEVGFLAWATVERTTPPLRWKTNTPVWVDQWPLPQEKLKVLTELVEEQVRLGHLVPSTSPWNTPIFVIKKSGKDKWRLLQDLRKVNNVIEDMGPLQPGLPSPSMLPRDWPLAIIDIKDCFFNIPLHPGDAPRFAFSVPTTNLAEPFKRYHWTTLPQGMKCSPVLCQTFVAQVLSPVRKLFPDAVILHYMDDILICAPTKTYLDATLTKTLSTIKDAGFQIAAEKIQLSAPWKYLGVLITERTIVPQHLAINDDPRTLRDMQQLCGIITWIRPLLGLTNEELSPLFDLLKTPPGDPGSPKKKNSELSLPCPLTPEARKALQTVADAIRTRQAHRVDSTLPLNLCVLGECPRFYALLFQWDDRLKDPLLIIDKTPIADAVTVFTDGSGKSHKSVFTWKDLDTQKWESDVQIVDGSPQIAELAAVVRAFKKFHQPINLVTDSAYVAGIAGRAEHALLKEVSNKKLYSLLSDLIWLISHREQPYHILHVRSHTELPGPIAEGNRRADSLAMAALTTPSVPDIFAQARLSHAFFHQNAPALARQFKISKEQARAIVSTCPNCQSHALPSIAVGVNPRGLQATELWQTDITHYTPFGRLKYIHTSIDTFSGAVFASTHTGEKAKDVIKHLHMAFATLGVPKAIKTDNGPAFTSKHFALFIQNWGIKHSTGIPHNPSGQSLVERVHKEIKKLLDHQHCVNPFLTPAEKLCKVLFVMNFLNCSDKEPNPPILRHFHNSTYAHLKERPPVLIKDPDSKDIKGPYPLVTWGRGYGCVSTEQGPRWIPAKFVKPFVEASTPAAADAEVPTETAPPDENAQDRTVAWRRRKKKISPPNLAARVLITRRYLPTMPDTAILPSPPIPFPFPPNLIPRTHKPQP
ncbi:uncharacterized protein LOC119696072 [Motacilla alba alba]|uniref:uncharacterized protein LOC119696072 n=1 Tax=Motacilla alba alba TaxID=1094192 RepID=UPI0018D4E09F|nr:uncharacterized protein LOC119696072 [Motacilla alba alba]